MSIITCTDVESLLSCIEKSLSSTCLLIWDCDGVLRIPQRKYMHLLEHSKELQKMLGEDPQRIWTIASHIWKEDVGILVDSRIRDTISDLRARNIHSLVLTQLMTGKVGPIEDTVQWRNTDLRNLGYDFRQSWTADPFYLDVPVRDPNESMSAWGLKYNRKPKFDSGVIYASYANKGDVLREFFLRMAEHGGIKVSRVIYIDDKASKIKHVKEACVAMGLDFCGIHFSFVELALISDRMNTQKARDVILDVCGRIL